jgi:hypothetical protein
MLIHWAYGDTTHYNGWLLPHPLCPRCALRLAEVFARPIYMSRLNYPNSRRMFVRTLLRHAHAAFSLCVNFLRSGMSHWTQP